MVAYSICRRCAAVFPAERRCPGCDGDQGSAEAVAAAIVEALSERLIDDFEARVTVVPSLKAATSFVVKGDWTFDRPVVAENPLYPPGKKAN